MSDKSAIEWTDATWNPVTGCTKVSPGCASCYIERTPAFRMTGQRFERGRIPVRLHHDRLEQPLHWRKPRRVFVVSMGDLFHEDVPDEFVAKVFSVMCLATAHTFQVLTKRPERMRELIGRLPNLIAFNVPANLQPATRGPDVWPLPNVWLGVSVENQRMAEERIPLLLETPAAVRFLSCEPLLGPLNLACLHTGPGDTWFDSLTGEWYGDDATEDAEQRSPRIDWVIVGGESGPGRAERKLVERRCQHCDGLAQAHSGYPTAWYPKPHALEWLCSIRDQCQAAGVPFFFKQWGGPRPTSGGRLLDGREWNEMPQREAVPA